MFDWNDKIILSSLRQNLKKRTIVIKVFKNRDLIVLLILFKDIIFIFLSKFLLLLFNAVSIFIGIFFVAN